jgi:hypothetical protein
MQAATVRITILIAVYFYVADFLVRETLRAQWLIGMRFLVPKRAPEFVFVALEA